MKIDLVMKESLKENIKSNIDEESVLLLNKQFKLIPFTHQLLFQNLHLL